LVESFFGLAIQSFMKAMAWVGSFFVASVVGLIFGFAYYERSFSRGLARLLMPFYIRGQGNVGDYSSSSVEEVWDSALKERDRQARRAEEYEKYKRETGEATQSDKGLFSTYFGGIVQGAKHDAQKFIIDKKTELTKSHTELAKAGIEKVRAEKDLQEAEKKKIEELLIEERERAKAFLVAERGWQEAQRELKQLEKKWQQEDREVETFIAESLERAQALSRLLQERQKQMEAIKKSQISPDEKKKQLQVIEQFYEIQLAQMGIMLSKPPTGQEDQEWL
ncbi:MAG: hypothetical protein QXI19_04775, partial [Candidatus Caldarchaeum sp.]